MHRCRRHGAASPKPPPRDSSCFFFVSFIFGWQLLCLTLLDVRPNCISWNIFRGISWAGGRRSCSGAVCRNLCLNPGIAQGLGVLTQHLLPLQPLPIPLRISQRDPVMFVGAICPAVGALGLQQMTSSVARLIRSRYGHLKKACREILEMVG